MSKKIWFKNKYIGWGWTPATWQGWALTGGYLLIILAASYNFAAKNNVTLADELAYVVPLLALTVLLFFICYRYGERPEWRWMGKPRGKR